MISKEEWSQMKYAEIYGMYVKLSKRIDTLTVEIDVLRGRTDRIGRVVK